MEKHDTALSIRQGFSESSTQLATVETSSSAAAAQAKAMIESRYVVAMRNPRNMDQFRQDLIAECRRPAFANNKSAYYVKPVGDGVEGLGIRFVEVAMRCMKNVLVESNMIFEDDAKEIHRVTVTDLEANTTWPLDVKVSKTVERSRPADDGSYITVRKNSRGRDVFTVPANDDDLLNKRGAQLSKAIRTLGLRIIPGDLQDEAERIIKEIRLKGVTDDPGAARKAIVDAFGELGVKAADLTEYLGHAIDGCSPPELVKLRGIYGAIKDGEATWKTVMDNKATGTEASPAAYPAERFAKEMPKWRQLIEAGTKTADQIIAMVQSKIPLSDAQKAEILAIKATASESKQDKPTGVAPPSIIEMVKKRAAEAAIGIAEVLQKVGAENIDALTTDQAEAAVEFIKNPF